MAKSTHAPSNPSNQGSSTKGGTRGGSTHDKGVTFGPALSTTSTNPAMGPKGTTSTGPGKQNSS